MVQLKSRNELPEEITRALQCANVFFDISFEKYVACSGWKIIFAYNENFVMPVGCKLNHHIFKTVSFESEPFKYTDSFDADEQGFMDEIIKSLKEKKLIDFMFETPTYGLFKSYPTQSKRIRFGNYVLDLKQEDLMASFTRKHRNSVRRGEKAGLCIKIGRKELLNDYIALDVATWKRSGVEKDNSKIYENIIREMPDTSLISIAYKDGIPQCGILGLFNKEMFYYMFGATADEPERGSAQYLHYSTMNYLKDIGVKAYNFVGCRINEDLDSKYHTIQRFKEGFGGDLVEGYMFKVVYKTWKYWLFNKLASIRAGATSGDIIDQEIYKWLDIN